MNLALAPQSLSTDELLQRAGVETASTLGATVTWSACVIDYNNVESVVDDLCESLEIFTDNEIEVISAADTLSEPDLVTHQDRVVQFIETLANSPGTYCLLRDFGQDSQI